MNEELKVIITAEIDKLKKELQNGKKEVENFAKKSKALFSDYNDAAQSVGDVSKKALAVVGGAVVGAAAALLALDVSTREYREGQAKLATAFETAGGSAKDAKKTYNDLYRVMGDSDTAVEAAGHLAKLTTNQEELSQWTNICQGVYATFGDSIPIEGLTEAANETAKTGALTGSLADALNWAGVSEDDFTKQLEACNTEAEREQLIRETLNGLYSDAAASYEENNAALIAQNEAQSKLNDSMAAIGEAITPINTALTSLAADILAELAPYIEDFAAEYLPQITEALSGVGEKIGEVIMWIADNWDLITTIGGIILGIAAAVSVFSTVMGIVNAVMAASPVTWIVLGIVAALAALVAIIVVVAKNWDDIKEKVSEVVTAISGFVSGMVESVGEWFSSMKDKMSTAVSNAKEAVVNKFNDIKTGISEKVSSAKEAVANKFDDIKTSMSSKLTAAKTSVTNAVTNISNTMKTKFTAAKTAVSTVFDGIKTSISEKFTAVKTKISGIITSIKSIFSGWKITLPKINLPKFSVSPEGWKIGDLLKGSIPKLSIKWNAMGGVFDTPTLFAYGNGSLGGLGEHGAEAVVPLENNLGWLNKLADMLHERMGGGTPIVLQVDGKTFAQTAVSSINNLTRQTGSLGLNIV